MNRVSRWMCGQAGTRSAPERTASSWRRAVTQALQGWVGRFAGAMREEIGGIDLRVLVLSQLLNMLPDESFQRIRLRLVRLQGYNVGDEVWLIGTPRIAGRDARRHLRIGRRSAFNVGVFLDASTDLIIGEDVALGHDVMVLTNTHELGPSTHRAGRLRAGPVHIGDGAWLGARSVVLPGVKVGAGAVVAAGAVVTADVPPDTLVAGIPALVKRALPVDERLRLPRRESAAGSAKTRGNGSMSPQT